MIVHHELLADIYLLMLGPAWADSSELALAQHLNCAVRSDKAAVWVDCRLLPTLSPTAARLLWACHWRLQRRQAQLVLCRVSVSGVQVLQQVYAEPQPQLCVVASLDEAVARLQEQVGPPTRSRSDLA